MSLSYVLNKRYDLSFTMQWIGSQSDVLSNYKPHQSITYISSPAIGLTNITGFNDVLNGETSQQYLKKFFKFRNYPAEKEKHKEHLELEKIEHEKHWSDEMPIDLICNIPIDPNNPLELQIIYYFVYDGDPSTNPPTNIYINNISINGNFVYHVTDSVATLSINSDEVILSPNDIYKVFKLEDFDIVLYSTLTAGVNVLYRITQNGGFSFTQWEPLTADNLRSIHFDEIRFCQFQYLLKFNGASGTVYVYDIILIGDFQNISANYLKTNRYGIKQDCVTYIKNNIDPKINTSQCSLSTLSNNLSCYKGTQVIDNLVAQNLEKQSNLFNPYKGIDKMVAFASMMASQTSRIVGHKAKYILRDPDGNGIDRNVFEYTLKNTVDMQDIKVIVTNNEFKDETSVINQLQMDTTDVQEVYIVKDDFHRIFGINHRPGRDDVVYLCPNNKLYTVRHALPHRLIMNASIWYRMILEKYEDDKSIRNSTHQDAEAFLNSLTQDTTIEEILGVEQKENQNQSANIQQTYPTSIDKLRLYINPNTNIIKEKINNGDIPISITQYQFTNLQNQIAVTYEKADQNLQKGDNRSFIAWFNIGDQYSPNKGLTKSMFNSYFVQPNTTYNLLDNYNNSGLGYRLNIEQNYILFQLNGTVYSLNVSFMTNVWYAVLINMNQHQGTIELNLYKRSTDITITFFNKDTYEKKVLITPDTLEDSYDPNNTGYTYYNAISDGYQPVRNEESKNIIGSSSMVLVGTTIINMTNAVSFSHNQDIQIYGSNNFKLTNIRIFVDVIPDDQESNILNQQIVRDAQYLLFADNANRKLITTNFWNTNFR